MLGQIVMSLIVQIGACGIAALIGAVVIGLATKLLFKFTPSYGIRYLAAFCGYIPLFVGRFLLAEFLGPYLTENNLPATAWLAPMTLTVVIWIVLQAAIYAVIIKGPKKGYIGLSSAFLISLLHFAVLAAAVPVVILIAVLIGILPFGNTVTFADVVEPILNARTVIFNFMGDEKTGPVILDIVVGSRIRRTMSNMDVVMIIDLESGKMLVLHAGDKTAVYADIKGPLQEKTRSYIEFVREVIIKLQDAPDIEELGEQEIEGQKAIGFVARGPNEEVTIWADPKTALPIRVEFRVGQLFGILKNFKFDEPIEDYLVSMDVPEGYTLEEAEIDFTKGTEEDFIESLRIWAEVLLDGKFPDAVGTENYMKQMPLLGEKLAQLDLGDDEKSQLEMKFPRGMFFLQLLETDGKYHYAGKGVKLGEADKAIFWYQPKDSTTYRVIYGDLSVKDVSPENLPK